jgi:hypothetical protein
LNKEPTRKPKIVRSADINVAVRSVRRTEPDYDKYAKALIAHVIEQHRKINPGSVKWYDERYQYRRKDGKI